MLITSRRMPQTSESPGINRYTTYAASISYSVCLSESRTQSGGLGPRQGLAVPPCNPRDLCFAELSQLKTLEKLSVFAQKWS